METTNVKERIDEIHDTIMKWFDSNRPTHRKVGFWKRFADKMNREFAAELKELGGKIVVGYHEDDHNTWKYGWSRSQYIDCEMFELFEDSWLIIKRRSFRAFERAHTYTAECCLMVGISRNGDGLYDLV